MLKSRESCVHWLINLNEGAKSTQLSIKSFKDYCHEGKLKSLCKY